MTQEQTGPGEPSGLSSEQTPDQIKAALDVARAMAHAGIPVFVARVALPNDNPNVQRLGFALPKGWQNTAPDPRVVDAWRPGMALCAVMGHGLDLLDVDPQNDADVSALFAELAAVGGQTPIGYAVAATPSGGMHSFIRSLGVGSHNGFRKGIDLKAGTGNKDHGFAFLAPTVRVSKTTGRPTPYRWQVPFDYARFAVSATDHSGEALAKLVEPPTVLAGLSNGSGSLTLDPAAFMRGVGEPAPSPLDNIPLALAAGRQTGTYKIACALRARGGLTLADAVTFMEAVVWPEIDPDQGGHDFTHEEFVQAIENAWNQYPDGREQREEERYEAQTILQDGTPREQLSEPAQPMKVARELGQAYVYPISGPPNGLSAGGSGDEGQGRYVLRWWRGGWMRWFGTHWLELERADVESELYQRLEHAVYWKPATMTKPGAWLDWAPTRNKLADVTDALGKGVVLLDSRTEVPGWLAASPISDAVLVSCTNGLLDTETGNLYPHHPDYFNLVSVPFAYQPGAPAPRRWLEFLGSLWPSDPHSIAALQEWFGYVLSGSTHLQKMMLVVGPKRSGKGTIARVLQQLVGAGNYSGPTLASLGQNFGLAPLVGVPLAVISDARLSGRSDISVIVERLLSISGEDSLTIDRKHREAWTGRLPTRFTILSNELPSFRDASNAITSRFVVLELDRSWYGLEDTALAGALAEELPGILNWALAGLVRVTAAGKLTEPTSSVEAITDMADMASPESAFVRECCQVYPGLEAPLHQVWAAWQGWAYKNGYERVGTVQLLARQLRAIVPGLRTERRGTDGKDGRYLRGISVKVGQQSPYVQGP